MLADSQPWKPALGILTERNPSTQPPCQDAADFRIRPDDVLQ